MKSEFYPIDIIDNVTFVGTIIAAFDTLCELFGKHWSVSDDDELDVNYDIGWDIIQRETNIQIEVSAEIEIFTDPHEVIKWNVQASRDDVSLCEKLQKFVDQHNT